MQRQHLVVMFMDIRLLSKSEVRSSPGSILRDIRCLRFSASCRLPQPRSPPLVLQGPFVTRDGAVQQSAPWRALSAEDELEDVVVDEVVAAVVSLELEDLAEVHRSLLFVDLHRLDCQRHRKLWGEGRAGCFLAYKQLAGDEDHDSTVRRGLGIMCADSVLDLLKRECLGR